MALYAVYMHDHTGDHAIKVFKSAEERQAFISQDAAEVAVILSDDGYRSHTLLRLDQCEVYVPDTGIYYEWICCDTELEGM